MFTELFTYDPATIDPQQRAQMASILRARSEFFSKSSEIAALRSRAWAGEEGLTDLIDLKAVNLAKFRQEYNEKLFPFIKGSLDVEGLLETLPMLLLAVLSKFNVPPMLLLEACGVDVDTLKLLAQQLKDLINE